MIVTKTFEMNGKEYRMTMSGSEPYIRCGKDRYVIAVDPVEIERAYFEENAKDGNDNDQEE